MLFATDETGSFALHRDSFDVSILTTLVCPPSLEPVLAEFVAERCAAWDLEELHAVGLEPRQRAEVATFLANQDLIWTASVIDNEIFPAAEVLPWQEELSENFERSWARSTERGSTHQRYRGRADQIRRVLNRRPGGSFVQYAIVMPRHIHDAVQAAIVRFRAPRWKQDWSSPQLLFDRKDRYGERLLDNILFPILASNPMTLDLPVEYQDAEHPLRSTHRSPSSGIELVSFFGGSPKFPESDSEPLIQLVDVIAWIAQRALRMPEDRAAQSAYRILRRRQYRTDVGRFRFFSRRAFELDSLRRYGHLVGGARA